MNRKTHRMEGKCKCMKINNKRARGNDKATTLIFNIDFRTSKRARELPGIFGIVYCLVAFIVKYGH